MHILKRVLAAIVAATPIAAAPAALAQQAYPARPVRVIVPTAAGGPTDIVLRGLGQGFAARTGQSFVIENRPGANTIIAAEACAKAPPDGYTLCTFPRSTISLNPALYGSRKLPYDAEKSFEPITNLVVGQQVLVLHPSIPATSFKELIEYSKRNPNRINFASAGVGSNVHLTFERMMLETGARFTHIPYKAASEAPLAFERGDVHMMYLIVGNPGVMEQIRAGQSRPLLTSGDARNPMLPEVPTFGEVGLSALDARNWFGMFAPAGTPKDVIDRLSAEFVAILRTPAFRDRTLTPIGMEAIGGTPEEFARFLAEDRRRGAELVKASGARLD